MHVYSIANVDKEKSEEIIPFYPAGKDVDFKLGETCGVLFWVFILL